MLLDALGVYNPNWNIRLSSFGYSDLLFDNTPGFVGREYLSGEWGAAVAYNRAASGAVEPTWLDPNFLYPDWQTNSNFSVVTPITPVGTEEFPSEAWSVIANGELEITQRFKMIDTVFGTPMGITAASGGDGGASVPSNRYVLQQAYEVKNTSSEEITDLQLFQFLHGLNSHTSLYDDRAYAGPLGEYQYDTTEFGVDPVASVLVGSNVAAGMFDSQGAPIGGPVTLVSQPNPSVSVGDTVALADGFAVAWIEQSTVGFRMIVRSFDPSGAPLGDPQLAAESSDGWIWGGGTVALGDGFAAVWLEGLASGSQRLVARRFDALGVPVAEPQILKEVTGEPWIHNLSSAPLADGFVVAWAEGNLGLPPRIMTQRYDLTASPLGEAQVVVDGAVGLDYREISGALPLGGGFLVTWLESRTDGVQTTMTIMAQPFDADGAPDGEPWTLVTSTDAIASTSAAALGDGFVLTYTAGTAEGHQTVLAQRFDGSGVPLTDPPLVVSENVGGEFLQNGRPLAFDDGYVVTWAIYGAAGQQLMTQRFDLTDNPVSAPQLVAEVMPTQYLGSRWAPVAVNDSEFAVVYSWDDYQQSGLEDYITFHSRIAPSALESGHYGIIGQDNHAMGKPSVGVHLSVEANALDGVDFFDESMWVAGAQRWDLGSLPPGETAVFDVILSILTGVQITDNNTHGSANGGAGVTGGVDYDFESIIDPGSLFAAFATVDVGSDEFQDRIENGQFDYPSFDLPGSYLQVWDLWFSGVFEGSVRFTVRYDESLLPPGTDESLLAIYHWDGSEWQLLAGVVDTLNNTITFSTTSLSPFAMGAALDGVNHAPVLDPIGSKNIDEEQPLSFTVTASDPDDVPPNALTLSVTGLPVGASFDPATGLFTWTPTESQQGTFDVTFQVTDDGTPNLSDSETITITVNEVNDAPVLGPIGNQSVDQDHLLSFTVTGSDPNDTPPNGLTLSASGLPPGATFDPGTGAFAWTPTGSQLGDHQVTFQVTDNGTPNLSDSETITITVNPVVQLPDGKGTNTVTVVRNGDNVQVLDSKKKALFDQPLSLVKKLTILGAANKSDKVTVEFAVGAPSVLPEGIVLDGGAGKQADTLTLRGTKGDDAFAVGAGSARVGNLNVQLFGVEQLTLDGGAGSDAYQIDDLSTKTTISDNKGTDFLDFSRAAAAVTVDLSKSSSQGQKIFAANNNLLALKGTFERATGTPLDDVIRGNPLANELRGGDGNDTLYGNSGNDTLYGGPGNDWLYGDAGDDTLYGETGNNVLLGGAGKDVLDTDAGVVAGAEGRNLLIGGAGTDTLKGGLGEEILIGGTTRYDAKAAALAVIMGEWTSTARPFDQRWQNIETGLDGGNLGLIQLVRKAKTTPKGTVLDDGLRDALFGGDGSDWFLELGKDDVDDRGAGDH